MQENTAKLAKFALNGMDDKIVRLSAKNLPLSFSSMAGRGFVAHRLYPYINGPAGQNVKQSGQRWQQRISDPRAQAFVARSQHAVAAGASIAPRFSGMAKRRYFVKLNDAARFMYVRGGSGGLKDIARTRSVRVPTGVLGHGDGSALSCWNISI